MKSDAPFSRSSNSPNVQQIIWKGWSCIAQEKSPWIIRSLFWRPRALRREHGTLGERIGIVKRSWTLFSTIGNFKKRRGVIPKTLQIQVCSWKCERTWHAGEDFQNQIPRCLLSLVFSSRLFPLNMAWIHAFLFNRKWSWKCRVHFFHGSCFLLPRKHRRLMLVGMGFYLTDHWKDIGTFRT